MSSLSGTAFSGVGMPILGVDANGNLAPISTSASGGGDQVSTNETGTSAGGADVSLTYTAIAGAAHGLWDVDWSYSAAPTGGELLIIDGTDTVFDIAITAAGPGRCAWSKGKLGRSGRLMTVTLKGGGGAIVGKINASHYVTAVSPGGSIDFSDEMNSGYALLFF